MSEVSSQGTKASALTIKRSTLHFKHPRRRTLTGEICSVVDFFNWGMHTCPSVQAGERLKVVLQRIYQENGAFCQEKRRDMRAHACLKSCHGKEETDLFCNHSGEKSKYHW